MVRLLSQVERIFLLVPFAGSAQGKQSARGKSGCGDFAEGRGEAGIGGILRCRRTAGGCGIGPICVKNTAGEVAYKQFFV